MPLTTDIYNADVFLVGDVHNVVRSAEETRSPVAGFRTKAHNYPTGAVFLSMRKIMACAKHYGLNEGKKLCIALSDQENSERRRSKYPNYKAGRVRREYSVFELVEHNGTDATRQHDPIRDFMEFITCLPTIRIVMLDPWETDDAMASFVAQTKKINKKAKFIILSKDRDMWSEMGDRVLITGGPGGEGDEFGINHLEHKFRITNPKLLPLAKALFGDSSDKLKKAVARVTEDNIPEGFLDLVKYRKGEPLSESFAKALVKHKSTVEGTSLEKCIGQEESIQRMIDLIRLRRKLKLKLVENRGSLKTALSLAAWYEFKSMPSALRDMFSDAPLGKSKRSATVGAGASGPVVRHTAASICADPAMAARFTQRRGVK